MPRMLRRAITTVAAAAIALGKHHDHTGAVMLATFAALALMAAANE